MDNLYNQRVINANNLFSDSFLDAKMLYVYCFNQLPSVNFVNGIDAEKAFSAVKERFASRIVRIHQYQWYKDKRKQYQFSRTLVITDNETVLEFDRNYCEI